MHKSGRMLVFVASLALGCCEPLFSQSDTVYQVSGGSLRGNITGVTQNDVTVSIPGASRKVEVPNIDRIILSDMPSRMRRALEAAENQQYQQALDLLEEVTLEARDRKILQQEYAFTKAYCIAQLALQGNGNRGAAAKAMVDFLRSHKSSYHYYDSLKVVGDLAIAMGRYDSASTSYGRMSKAPFPEYQARGTSLEAKALQAAGKPQEALAKYEAVLKLPNSSPESRRQKLLATAGKASCMAELGQPQQAIPEIRKIIAENDPQDQELFARTYNALGTCHRAADQPMDAILAYMRTHLLFSSNSDSHAEALYHLTNLWPQVDKPEKAARMRNLLKTRYAGTAWAQK